MGGHREREREHCNQRICHGGRSNACGECKKSIRVGWESTSRGQQIEPTKIPRTSAFSVVTCRHVRRRQASDGHAGEGCVRTWEKEYYLMGHGLIMFPQNVREKERERCWRYGCWKFHSKEYLDVKNNLVARHKHGTFGVLWSVYGFSDTPFSHVLILIKEVMLCISWQMYIRMPSLTVKHKAWCFVQVNNSLIFS